MINPSKGLRPSKRVPRNSQYLVECIGAVGRDQVLQVLSELTKLNVAVSGSFPYPQIFVFTTRVIICNSTDIYEYDGSLSSSKITVTAGSTWKAADYYDYIVMSNGKVTVVRDPQTGSYSLSDVPVFSSICNYNGQTFIGSPGVEVV